MITMETMAENPFLASRSFSAVFSAEQTSCDSVGEISLLLWNVTMGVR